MTALPPIHLCIVQPLGYVHSLGLVDPARYFRYQFRRFGADVSIAKNRLRHDAVNFVFGAHLGFDAEQCRRHVCIVVNLEQLGNGGARVAPAYLDLLRRGAVVDYDAANVATYAQNPDDVPLVSFLHAPYLDDGQALPLEQRPIDLLFFGSMNERRRAFIAQVEAAGVQVSCFDHPLYGAERDHFIRQAKAVLNCHFYASSRFEQARAFSCLSLGTPVISERSAATQPPPGFDDVVFWLEEGAVAPFFTGTFGQPSFFDAARRKLEAFRGHDAVERYADLLAFAAGYFGAMSSRLDTAPWQPRRLAVGFDDYRAGWLNIAVTDSAEADVRFDPAHPLDLPARLGLGDGGVAELHAGRVAQVAVEGRSVGTDDARAALLHHALAWLEPAGTLAVERAEDVAWRQLVTEHWRYGDGEHRFAVAEGAAAAGPVLALTKTALTLRERTIARMHRADFGGLPDDGVPASAGAAVPDLTVVCVSYKRYEQLPILIHSFLAQSVPSFKLLVLHDGHDARMEAMLARYKREHPGRIDYRFTEHRHNDYGHSLRDIGIRMADTEYILLTNDDNYYCPKFIELMMPPMKAQGADIALCNMIHSHDRPGLRPQPAYMPFDTRPERGSVDIGSFITRTAWAQQVGFRDKSHDGDATYFEDLLRCSEQPKVLKVERTLFVHN